MASERAGMLSPYRVLDLTDERGYLCGRLLGDLGADVIKVEKPGGDSARRAGPFYKDDPDPNRNLHWWAFNTNKRGLTLNLETEKGRDLLLRMAVAADILIESFDPGYLDSLDLGYPSLSRANPGLIMTSISGFGRTGPYSLFKDSDLVVWALSGNAYLTGDPDRGPLAPSVPLSFLFGAVQGAIGALTALYQRGSTGHGQYVDASAQLSLIWPVGPEAHGLWEQDRTIVKRQGRWWSRPQTGQHKKTTWINIPLLYECKDGDITFAAMAGPGIGRGTDLLVEWMASEGMAGANLRGVRWTEFDWQSAKQELVDEFAADFTAFFSQYTKAELLAGAEKRGIMLYPAFGPQDLLDFPQLAARGFWQKVDHGALGEITYPGAFFRSSEGRTPALRRAPLIGEHNEEIFVREMGFSREELKEWERTGII
jgi:crotonobetainyl-CoA:carnitine CoA-transferase CaiB-like acyl-CoA transferase